MIAMRIGKNIPHWISTSKKLKQRKCYAFYSFLSWFLGAKITRISFITLHYTRIHFYDRLLLNTATFWLVNKLESLLPRILTVACSSREPHTQINQLSAAIIANLISLKINTTNQLVSDPNYFKTVHIVASILYMHTLCMSGAILLPKPTSKLPVGCLFLRNYCVSYIFREVFMWLNLTTSRAGFWCFIPATAHGGGIGCLGKHLQVFYCCFFHVGRCSAYHRATVSAVPFST